MTHENGPHVLSEARNVVINGGLFPAVSRNMMIYQGSMQEERRGFNLLLANISTGAFHDAAERGDPPKCHPHTRQAILAEIMGWITDPQARKKFIIWLYGPAGSGKTAICQNIAETCAAAGFLAASFFFGRLAAGRNTLGRLIPTIAYQLSRAIPETENHLLTAIENDPTIFNRSLSTQLQCLIINPLMSAKFPIFPRVIVVDGVDECGPNDQSHKELLNLLGGAAKELQNIPVLFLIGSRPEYEIRTTFNTPLFNGITTTLVLDDKYKPNDDIRAYFKDEFCRIQTNIPLSANPWPSSKDIETLVKKASGQFIFAATVIRFMDSPRQINLADRLKIILGLSSAGNQTPFALLDALYRYILASIADIEMVLKVLTWLILKSPGQYGKTLNLIVIEELLGVDIQIALVDMHALVFVPKKYDNATLSMHHASLYDFLLDRTRSLDYFIDKDQGHLFLSRCWLNIMANYHQYQISKWEFIHRPVELFIYHCDRSPDALSPLAQDLVSFDLRRVLEGIHDFRDLYRPDWVTFFSRVQQKAGRNACSRLKRQFVTFILDRISEYPPKLRPYIPIIFVERFDLEDISNLFHIILFGIRPCKVEYEQLCVLDKKFLDIQGSSSPASAFFAELFGSYSYMGRRLIRREMYPTLVKQIINNICPMPTDDGYHHVRVSGVNNEEFAYLQYPKIRVARRYFIEDILRKTPPNTALALFLHKHAMQYNPNIAMPLLGSSVNHFTWNKLAEISLDYISRCRCNAQYLVHTHIPETTDCFMCSNFEDEAVVVDRLPASTCSRLYHWLCKHDSKATSRPR